MVAVLLFLGLLMHTCTVVQSQEDYNETLYLDNKPCFSVNLRLSATIYYQKDDGNTSIVDIVGSDFATPPPRVTCNIGSELGSASIDISWPSIEPHFYTFHILFSADFEVGWSVERMIFLVNTANNPDFDEPSEEYFELYNDKDLTVDNITLTKSYKCDSNITHPFSSSASNSTALLTTTLLQLQAFQFNNDNGDFGPADMQCVEDIDDSKVLPIIVGTVITFVLLVALMLYIIARVVKHRRDTKQPLLT